MASLSTEDIADLAGGSIETLEKVADRLPKEIDYLTFQHPTKGGGVREVVAPAGALDTIAKNLYRGLSQELPYRAPTHVHGFVRGRSTVSNASAHLDKACVLRIDLDSFFPSIKADRVESALSDQGLTDDAAKLCRRLLTIKERLPIGLSTSPLLSNLVFLETDIKLASYATENQLSFTRYVDDLAFSGEVYDRHLHEIQSILTNDAWMLNERKTAFMRRGGPQYVTGLYVGCADQPRIPRNLKRQLRWISHIIETVGYDTYLEDFGGRESNMYPKRLIGWARYVASVEPDIGYPLLRLFREHLPS